MKAMSMLVAGAIGACWILGASSPAAAGLKSGKVTTTLANPANQTGPFTNGVSKGGFTFKGTKTTIKAKGINLPDTDGNHCSGDEVICLINVTATLSGSMDPVLLSVVLVGEVAGGKVTASHDMCKDRNEGVTPDSTIFCPEFFGMASPIALSSIDAVCYAADPAWMSANPVDLAMSLTGHECEGVVSQPMTVPSTVLFSSGSTIIVP